MTFRRLGVLSLMVVSCAPFANAGEHSGEDIHDAVMLYRTQNEVEILRELATLVTLPNTATNLDDMERNGILERHAASLEQEFVMLEELVRQARIEGASGIYDGLRESVLDPGMVQQVVEHSILQTSED